MAKRIQLNEAQLKQIIKEAIQDTLQQQAVQQAQPQQQTGYKILFISGGNAINIGGRPCQVGDVFQDQSQIQWGNVKAIKALDIATNKQYVFKNPQATPQNNTPMRRQGTY